jgi:hypothetical protein
VGNLVWIFDKNPVFQVLSDTLRGEYRLVTGRKPGFSDSVPGVNYARRTT